MTFKRILITGLLAIVGFVVTPMTFALVGDSLNQSSVSEADYQRMTMMELLKSEQEAIAKYQSNVQIIAVMSVVGAVAGATFGLTMTRKSKKDSPVT